MTSIFPSPAWKICFCITPEGACGNELEDFSALFARDVRVARRNLLTTVLQTMLQPLLLVFVFGQVLTRSGMMANSFKGILLPGIMAISMTMTGMMGVAMPLIAEFQFTREIEDRSAGADPHGVAGRRKNRRGSVAGAGFGRDRGDCRRDCCSGPICTFPPAHLGLFCMIAVLVAVFASAGGMTLGCSVGQTQIGLIFSLVLAPMIMFGCAYYPWSALASFPILQKIVLINPLVYASEGLRGTLAPQYPHMEPMVIIAVLGLMDAILIFVGLNRFQRKAVS